jgi:hypothetical protein
MSHPKLNLPPDADELMAEAQTRTELRDFRHATDAVIALNTSHQSVHQTHRNLRARIKRKLEADGIK